MERLLIAACILLLGGCAGLILPEPGDMCGNYPGIAVDGTAEAYEHIDPATGTVTRRYRRQMSVRCLDATDHPYVGS